MRSLLARVAASFVSGLAAAQVTAIALVTQRIQVQYTGYPAATLPVGVVPASGATAFTGGTFGPSSWVTVAPLPTIGLTGSQGWTVEVGAVNFTAGPVVVSTFTGRVLLQFAAPLPRSGVLALTPVRTTSSAATVTGDVTVDVDGDSVPDYFVSTSGYTEIPLTVVATGTAIAIDLALQVTTQWVAGTTIGEAHRDWKVMFVPDTYGMELAAPGCAGGLTVTRSPTSFFPKFTLVDPFASGPATTIVAAWLALGLAPAAIQLPFTPFCTLGVQSPAIFDPNASSGPWIKNWELPAVQLPPGLQFHAQVVWMRTTGQVYATDVFRTF